MHARPHVTQRDVEGFLTDGAVCLRKQFDRTWIEKLAVGVEKNFTNTGPNATYYTPPSGPGGFYDDYCNWRTISEYGDFVHHSPSGAICGQLMQSHRVRIYHEHVLIKEPGTEEVTPWHHDLPYYGVEGSQLCSLWLPLDPIPKFACPEFIAGSHRWGKRFIPRLFISHEGYGEEGDGYEFLPDMEQQREQNRVLSWELEPGDCIVFHMLSVHGAPNTQDLTTRRRGFSTRWLGDDAVFATRPWKTSPPFPDVNLAVGEPMAHEAFPVVWSD
jgi:ectoine hydroxylase-related dioxygenase (phytanoyl-CoA dioxygenase family)